MFDRVKRQAWSGLKTVPDDAYVHLQLPYEKGSGKSKVLFVLDGVPGEDLRKGNTKLLSGDTGALLEVLVKRAAIMSGNSSFSWMAVTYNAYRTFGKSKEAIASARDDFKSRLDKLVSKYDPTHIVCFGQDPYWALCPAQRELTRDTYQSWLGVPVKVGTRKVTACLSLRFLADGSSAGSSILGYQLQCLANGLRGTLAYKVDEKAIEAATYKLIETPKAFDKLMDRLEACEGPVAIDTETRNLNRVRNSLQTIQFATSADAAYVVPLFHKDSPWSGDEIKHIVSRLRKFFKGGNKNPYHIYVNAQFDLNVMRSGLGIDYFANKLYDVFSGEFAFDENKKFLGAVCGGANYYSLRNLSMQYGCTLYERAEFGKDERATIADVPLSSKVVRYCGYDCTIPFAIHEQQLKHASDIGYKKFLSVVTDQFSDMIHSFSVMESTGSLVDVDYLFSLRMPDSQVAVAIRELGKEINSSKAAMKANKLLLAQSGRPTQGLFSTSAVQVFDIEKQDHQKLLFFDVLGLEPLAKGKSGQGKLDKHFQKAYEHVPEVEKFTALGKAKKLRNAYVKSFLRKLRESEDMRSDRRVRARYNYLKIVTNRTSSSDPNLQQIPARGKLAKLIKRLFIAPPGHLYIKVDYKAHEVRGWGYISADKAIAAVFQKAKDLWDTYKLTADPELKKRLKAEADIHIINACYFFGIDLAKISPEELADKRNAVKGVTFGLIYQMSLKSLAKTIKQAVEATREIYNNFVKRFPNGMGWIERAKTTVKEMLFYENPLGFRRHLWGFLYPKGMSSAESVHGRNSRQGVNSPIQGMCAGFMMIAIRALQYALSWELRKRKVEYHLCNSVHDSLETTFAYRFVLLGIAQIERSMTDDVARIVKERHGMVFNVPLEVDMELGSALSNTSSWDYSLPQLERLLISSILFQKYELHHDVDVVDAMTEIFEPFEQDAPAWMKAQAKHLGWKPSPKRWRTLIKELETAA